MSFSECFPIAATVFLLGASLCSLFCVIFGKAFKKNYLSGRFIHFCLLLSAAAICSVWTVFKAQNYLIQFPSVPVSDIIYFSVLFIAGVLCTRFWKTAIPVFLIAYIALTAYTAVFLYSEFGTAENKYSITVKSDKIQINGEEFVMDGAGEKQIKFSAYTIPSKLIVPFPKNWYRLESVIDNATQGVYESQSLSQQAGEYNFYQKWLLSNRRECFVLIPEAQSLPAVYDVVLTAGHEEITTRLDRTF